MSIDAIVEYENELSYMMYNNYDKEKVHLQFLEYQRHLFIYDLLNRPMPKNNYEVINRRVMDYVKKGRT